MSKQRNPVVIDATPEAVTVERDSVDKRTRKSPALGEMPAPMQLDLGTLVMGALVGAAVVAIARPVRDLIEDCRDFLDEGLDDGD
jgi:hypothetical protein